MTATNRTLRIPASLMLFRRRAAVTDSFVIPLPSSVRGLDFTARFTLTWAPTGRRDGSRNAGYAARCAVEETAEEVSTMMPVTRFAAAEHHINTELATLRHSRHDQARIDSAQVSLTVDPTTARTAAEYDKRLRDEYLADEIQRHELDRLQRFRDTVLRDPASAMSYWFMNHPEHLDETIYTRIETLVSKIADHDPTKRWLQIARILDDFIDDLTADDKGELLRVLHKLLSVFGHRTDADRIAVVLDRTDILQDDAHHASGQHT